MTDPGYLAFATPPGEDGRAAAARWAAALAGSGAWRRAFFDETLQVWVKGERPPPVTSLRRGRAVVVGRLFGKDAGGWRELPAEAVRAARRLTGEGWGAYVALLRDEEAG